MILTILLATVLAATLPAAAGTQEPTSAWQEAKVAPDLRQALDSLAAGELLPVVVTFHRQADLARIEAASRAGRLEQVIRTLQQTASATQLPFRAVLDQQRQERQIDQVTHFWIFNGLSLSASAQAIAALAARPEVGSIALDETIPAPPELVRVPGDAAASASEWNLTMINAPALWQLGFQGQGVVVASMDTGVSLSHPDLVAQWRGGTNSWFDPYGEHPTTPTDLNGHGTATMGIMVGGDAGGTNIGVAPLAQWIAVKIFNDRGSATSTGIHQGFQWLLDPDGNPSTADAPHVVNNSWRLLNTSCDLGFQLDLQALRAAGILPVFSAGNSGPGDATSVSPANNPEGFAVGATDALDQIWSGSARGPSACGELATLYPEMVAPGVEVRTAGLYGTYQTATGTSLSAPHVAGALALLLSADPNLTVAQQEEALLQGAVDLGPLGPDNTYGQGRLDVLAAYDPLITPTQLSITKLDTPDPVRIASTLTYTLTVTNEGPSVASLVTVTDTLPAGVIFGGASGVGWDCLAAGQEVTCTLSGLGIGVAPGLVITATAPGSSGPITNVATVSSYELDRNLYDNAASASTLVVHYTYLPIILK
ncbi:MAG: S8 family serine peptidase [Anaerolineae bacterium]